MSAALANAAMATIHGGQDAQRLVFAIRQGCAPADALLEGLQQVQAVDDAERTRSFCRELQKALERHA